MNVLEKRQLYELLEQDKSFTNNSGIFQKRYKQKEVREIYETAVKIGYEFAILNPIKFDVKLEETSEFYKEFIELCKKHDARINYNIFNGGLYFVKNVPRNK